MIVIAVRPLPLPNWLPSRPPAAAPPTAPIPELWPGVRVCVIATTVPQLWQYDCAGADGCCAYCGGCGAVV